MIVFFGLALMCLFPYFYGVEPFGLMPGLVIYFACACASLLIHKRQKSLGVDNL